MRVRIAFDYFFVELNSNVLNKSSSENGHLQNVPGQKNYSQCKHLHVQKATRSTKPFVSTSDSTI